MPIITNPFSSIATLSMKNPAKIPYGQGMNVLWLGQNPANMLRNLITPSKTIPCAFYNNFPKHLGNCVQFAGYAGTYNSTTPYYAGLGNPYVGGSAYAGTVGVMVLFTTASASRSVFATRLNTSTYDGIMLNSSKYICMYARLGGSTTVTRSSVLAAANTMYVIFGRYDGANVSVWVNGVKVGEGAQTAARNLSTYTNFCYSLGATAGVSTNDQCSSNTNYYWAGGWNRALSDDEIVAISQDPVGIYSNIGRVPYYFTTSGATSVYSDSSYLFDINNIITSDLALKWDMLNIITSDSTLKYDILNTVYNDKTIKWDIFNTVVSDSSLRWDMSGLVSSDLAMKWDMAGVTYSDFTCKFDILNQIASDLAIKFDITSTVIGDLILKFDINSTVSSDLRLLWDAIGTVYSDCIIRYGIDESGMTGYFFVQDPLNRYSKYNKHKNYKKRYKVV